MEKAEILNKFFASLFTKESLTNLPDFLIRTDKHLNTIDINTDIVWKYIKKTLKISKSVGPDNFHPKFLAETSENIKTPLTKLFKKSLELAKIPDLWRLANITPFHKPEDQ